MFIVFEKSEERKERGSIRRAILEAGVSNKDERAIAFIIIPGSWIFIQNI